MPTRMLQAIQMLWERRVLRFGSFRPAEMSLRSEVGKSHRRDRTGPRMPEGPDRVSGQALRWRFRRIRPRSDGAPSSCIVKSAPADRTRGRDGGTPSVQAGSVPPNMPGCRTGQKIISHIFTCSYKTRYDRRGVRCLPVGRKSSPPCYRFASRRRHDAVTSTPVVWPRIMTSELTGDGPGAMPIRPPPPYRTQPCRTSGEERSSVRNCWRWPWSCSCSAVATGAPSPYRT